VARRNDVTSIADDEHFTRFGLSNQIWVNPGVRAGDEEDSDADPGRVARTSPGGYLHNWFGTNVYLESAFSWLRFSPIALCNTFLSITDANTFKKGVVMLAAILYLLVINN